MSDTAIVVGAGPNGLAAGITLARAGLEVTVLEAEDEPGGGARSAELTLPGVVHDICSAIHPLGVASPFFRRLPLADHGLVFRDAPVAVAHPLDDGTAGAIHPSVAETAAGLGEDGRTWERLFAALAERWDVLSEDVLGPLLRFPSHPLVMARFGLRALIPATVLARGFDSVRGKALFAGVAAHSVLPLEHPFSGAFALMLGTSGHVGGWPVAEGGSGAITAALVAELRRFGGEVHTGVRVERLDDLPPHRVAMLDVTPRQAVDIVGDRLPPRTRRRYEAWRYGPAAFKLDLAVEGGIPWTAEPARGAGTVHVGGTLAEIADAERSVAHGRAAARPFVLVGQQYLADPTRSAGDVHPVWMYCHVPNGFDGDASESILDQVERFAPGFRDRIVGRHTWTPAAIEAHDANYVGGDISGGAHDGLQLLGRPVLSLDPYATGTPGVFLCSSSTPPGGGVHGMCGYHAARSALRSLGYPHTD